jgi:hypothetical protein
MNFVIKDLWYAKKGRHLNFTRKLLMGIATQKVLNVE